MTQRPWPEVLVKACHHAYTLELHGACEEDFIWPFLARWGGYTPDILARVLQEGKDDEKILALFALGSFASPEAPHLLFPFVDSAKRMERWASAMALGWLKDERVFSLVQKLLLEGLQDDHRHIDDTLERAVREAQQASSREVSEDDDVLPLWKRWERLLDPALVTAYHQAEQQQREYEWCLMLRWTIADILGAWGNPHAVPTLRHALGIARKLEQQRDGYAEDLRSFQDHLAHALGRLEAWGALCGLDLPPAHLHVARIYLTLGALGVTSPKIYYYPTMLFQYPDLFPEGMLEWDEGRTPLPHSYRLKRFLRAQGTLWGLAGAELEAYVKRADEAWEDVPEPPLNEHAPLYLNPVPIMQVLEARFGLSKTEQIAHTDYQPFCKALQQRDSGATTPDPSPEDLWLNEAEK